MPGLAALGDRDVHGLCIGGEVAGRHGRELPVAASGKQGGGHQCTELLLAGVDQPLGLGVGEIADLR